MSVIQHIRGAAAESHGVTFSKDQRRAANSIERWLARPGQQVFRLDGVAGSGKTALAVAIGRQHGARFGAFSGKAASVMRERGADNATTLHSLLYFAPIETKKDGIIRLEWVRRDRPLAAPLIVADECSQIDKKLARDLLATRAKILLTGDPEQLPPIQGTAFFDGPADASLTEIHRQAAGSQPLQMATAVRLGETIRPAPYDRQALAGADIIICALNSTRRRINGIVRRLRGFGARYPEVGDTVCCFRTRYESGVMNGSLWRIDAIDDANAILRLSLSDDLGHTAQALVPEACFAVGFSPMDIHQIPRELDVFDYGYAITCHKAQGSEWKNVVVIDETSSNGFAAIRGSLQPDEFRRRWLYTGITRAKEAVQVMEAPA